MESRYIKLMGTQVRHLYNLDTDFRFGEKQISESEIGNRLVGNDSNQLIESAGIVRFTISSTEDKKLQGMGLVFKPVNNGFNLFIDTCRMDPNALLESNSEKLSRIKEFKNWQTNSAILDKAILLGRNQQIENIVLRVKIQLLDKNFFNYSTFDGNLSSTHALSSNIKNNVFYFTNSSTNKKVNDSNAFLHADSFVTSQDTRILKQFEDYDNFNTQFNYPDETFSKQFGILDIKLLPGLISNYFICFNSGKSRWKYIIKEGALAELVREKMDQPSNPAIINSNGDRIFNGPEIVNVQGNKTVIVFTSKEVIPYKIFFKDCLSMVEGLADETKKYKKVIINNLPFPDVKFVSGYLQTENKSNNNEYVSEIFF